MLGSREQLDLALRERLTDVSRRQSDEARGMSVVLKVLLVEDSDDDAELVLRELRRSGYAVTHQQVQTGPAMARALEEQVFDVIISDFSMPEFSAPDALAVLRESGLDIPFIIVSGTIGEETAVDSLKGGAHDFLVKGRLARLAPTIQRELREAAVRRRQRDAEEALRASEERFRTLVMSMDDIVFTLDSQQRHEGIFGSWLERGDLRAADFIGKTARELLGAEASVHEAANARALSGERVVYEWSQERPEGTRYFQTSLSPRRSPNGTVNGLVGVGRDVTEQRRIQAQLAISDRLASIGMLAAGVAHEINNPLAAVLGNVDLALAALSKLELDEGAATLEEALAGLRDAREAGARIRNIIRDLKLLSRDEESEQESTNVERVLDSSLNMARTETRYRARVVKEYGGVPPVRGSESRLGQVFLNLIVNAAQALPEGQAETNEIRVTTARESETLVRVEIKDSGSGIPPDVQRRLFTPFFTTKPTGEGTGLGLSICQRIVSGLGGEITVRSEVGRGTTFTVLLPRSRDVPKTPRGTIPAFSVSTRRGRVLVVDDEKLVGATVRRAIEREHDVETLDSARAALEHILAGTQFDVILCDLIMPHMTGMDLYDELKAKAPDNVERMIFLTGGAFTPRAGEFLATVENLRLEKPFDLGLLRAAVNARVAESAGPPERPLRILKTQSP
jgi:PAS domain S-box-containing protein